ncbi:hypothetical protein [Candidatus Clostridium radicumherbarum]|uniref:Uncharacterized protein n=1 Tax=Candidatus Clostridium radicumherbarum TaxID=3381662 RepID=A0ABW8TUW5_9CLOT
MGIGSFFKGLFSKEEENDSLQENDSNYDTELEIEEEEKVVVALAASIMAGKDKPDSHFHISKIRRVK